MITSLVSCQGFSRSTIPVRESLRTYEDGNNEAESLKWVEDEISNYRVQVLLKGK